jgi:hypothetical protein
MGLSLSAGSGSTLKKFVKTKSRKKHVLRAPLESDSWWQEDSIY